MKYTEHFSATSTVQTEAIPGKKMVKNAAGGFVFQINDWSRLDRFLILGSEGGTYYATEKKLTVENAEAVLRCIQEDGIRTVNRIVQISDEGRAAKNDPAIFALSLCASFGNAETKAHALSNMDKVCRIGTHLFQFAEAVQNFRGWGRGLKRAVQQWYLNKDVDKLAYQIVKYAQRNGWTHKDILRLSHPKSENPAMNSLLRFAVGKESSELPDIVQAYQRAKNNTNVGEVCKLISDHNLPMEAVPKELLTDPKIWASLLPNLPMTAMIRNLGNMTKCGLLKPLSNSTNIVADKLTNEEFLKKARVHPFQILVALKTYSQGRGFRGSGSWDVVPQITDAMDDAFYKSFKYVEPAGKRWLLGVDVSGSMSSTINNTNIMCCEASAAIAMTIARVEPKSYIHGFCDTFVNLGISAKTRLDDAVKAARRSNFGGTDCALPMIYAQKNGLEVDAFVVITDNETWAGKIHPVQALNNYRKLMGIPSKLIVVGMTATNSSIGDPADPGILDIVGFDAALPIQMFNFVKESS